MKWSSLEALHVPRWVPVPPDKTLEVEIVPAASIETMPLFYSPMSDHVIRRVCGSAFINFRGAEGSPPNSLEARVKLYNWGPCREAINAALAKASQEAAEGEDVAASALPGTE